MPSLVVDVVLMQGFAGFMWLLSVALILFSGFALIDAATRREDAYRAADKKTKPFWLIILGLAFVVNLIFNILSFLPIIGLVATIVYMVDVRPALRGLPGGGRSRRGGSSSDGPSRPLQRRPLTVPKGSAGNLGGGFPFSPSGRATAPPRHPSARRR
ncbi:hypothetical protein SALBM311S_11314 [Streptomyces alboniger]